METKKLQKKTQKQEKPQPQVKPKYLQVNDILASIIETSERVTFYIESKSNPMPQRQKNRLLKNHAKRIKLTQQLIKTIQFDD